MWLNGGPDLRGTEKASVLLQQTDLAAASGSLSPLESTSGHWPTRGVVASESLSEEEFRAELWKLDPSLP